MPRYKPRKNLVAQEGPHDIDRPDLLTSVKKILGREKTFSFISFFITSILLFIFWIFLSGRFDLFHLSLGILCCTLVAYMSHDLLFKDIRAKNRHIEIIRIFKYIPWLFYQIVLANIHVSYLALHPKLPINPKIIRFKSKLKKDLALVTYANSITLTPGTITVLIKDREYYVHVLSKKVADELLTGEMENKIAHIYLEE
jgi:multicomponent Na+:H+ antiporter subunit E